MSQLGQGRLWPAGGWHSRSTPSSGNTPCVPALALRAKMRNPHGEQMFSALLLTSDVIRQRSSWATSITARAVGHPAEGKALRPQHSPRVVFFELARFRAVGQKASLGTPQAGARPMTRPRGLGAAHAPLRRPLSQPTAQVEITSLRAAPGRAKDRCSRKPLADLPHPQIFRRFLAARFGTISNDTLAPSGRPSRPAFSTAEIWTKTSLPPPSGAMKP
jgi:hypothetical protein